MEVITDATFSFLHLFIFTPYYFIIIFATTNKKMEI